jgi:ATP-binding cassette, subfamily B, bacterial
LRQRLLSGALQLDASEVRRRGAGGLLGVVLEADAVESLAVGGGMLALVAGVELLLAAFVLRSGAQSGTALGALTACLAITAVLASRYYAQRQRWTHARLTMTEELVAGIVGNRTRLAQEREPRWHVREDAALTDYLSASRRLDRLHAALTALVPRGFLLAGVVSLAPSFVEGSATATDLAISVGGLLLAFRALRTLVTGLTDLVGAAVAWEQVRPLQQAAVHDQPISTAALGARPDEAPQAPALLDAHRISFTHARRASPALRECSLAIRRGDRVLLEGPSGAGKSTLGSLLAGLLEPSSGLLLLGGLDRRTLGLNGWRQRVVSAPQFQENHVIAASFAFNLLMGRRWPPRAGDLEEAEAVCRELGLGPLLNRMPAGVMQLVGDTGWQLSHGERSRLFIARTLLQPTDVIILDESFAALDPETLRDALHCALERSPTLVVIAHP